MSILNNITAAGCRRILMLAMMVLSAVFLCAFRADAAGRVSGLRIGQGIGSVRIVFDADAEFDYNVFLLDGPKRLVVDTKNVYVGKALEKTKDKNNLVGRVRVGDIHDGKTRIVFDLLKPVVVKKVFMLPPQSTFKWRLAIDVTVASEREFRQKAGIDNAYGNKSLSLAGSVQAAVDATPKPRKQNARKIIVIDAGHGGHDPGAIGYSGVHEKNITLAMAKELKRQLDRKGEYTVYLTRSTRCLHSAAQTGGNCAQTQGRPVYVRACRFRFEPQGDRAVGLYPVGNGFGQGGGGAGRTGKQG